MRRNTYTCTCMSSDHCGCTAQRYEGPIAVNVYIVNGDGGDGTRTMYRLVIIHASMHAGASLQASTRSARKKSNFNDAVRQFGSRMQIFHNAAPRLVRCCSCCMCRLTTVLLGPHERLAFLRRLLLLLGVAPLFIGLGAIARRRLRQQLRRDRGRRPGIPFPFKRLLTRRH